jgi:hypothetical protein
MPEEDVRRLVDIEADLDDGLLSQVPFGRRRFLRTLGLALFGVATGMVASQQAAGAAPTPSPCWGYPRCPQCKRRGSRIVCTHPKCGPSDPLLGCETSNGCWTSCYDQTLYNCCDYTYNNKPCICSSPMGAC